jgi:hypothetical protein
MEFEDWEARLSGAGGVEMPVEQEATDPPAESDE